MSDRVSPLRVLRYHDRITGIVNGQRLGPIRAQIDLTNLCNHKCPWCEPLAYRESTIQSSEHSLSVDLAEDLLGDLRELEAQTIIFSGGGEPLVHPFFGTWMKEARAHGFKIAVNTNGYFLDKWHKELLLADNVRISLDATNATEHEQQHGVKGQFDRICTNIQKFTAEANRPEVGISFVVSDCNRASVPNLEAFRKHLGVDFVYPREERAPEGPKPDFKVCYSAIAAAVIGANGDVQACCDRRDITFGNINQKRFRDIWLSREHRDKAGKIIPQFCTKCVQSHFNQGVERFVINDEAAIWIV